MKNDVQLAKDFGLKLYESNEKLFNTLSILIDQGDTKLLNSLSNIAMGMIHEKFKKID